MKNKITIRQYKENDAQDLAGIYYNTIHNINIRDYSPEQINAWAPSTSLELNGWKQKWEKITPVVALLENTIVGFAEFEPDGHIDCFYVHHEFQNQGVASALMTAIEKKAKENNVPRIYAEVSITAKPFFEKRGFQVIKKQSVTIRGCQLTNFVMEKALRHRSLSLRLLTPSDIPVIVEGFTQSNWTGKPASIFEQYLNEQQKQKRIILVAYLEDHFAGYVTLKWESQYSGFKENNIPEIMDLNVLPAFRKLGIGTALMEKAEKEAALKYKMVGIGVGLYADYGSAQKLYINRGYIPDGKGITYNYQPTIPGKSYPLDDDLVLWFTKKCNSPGTSS
ncbi:GNAT family N-acetyltransferase [Legionella sp. 16cNR16C]|uniref:GNAT family N-acetyltransferase n=1 Tax=Legionella sp. 16cNR16C TaxID=2905656 RepID=UPI001E456E5F|nr:GNAT family N-acetyltransferase [Legionella sp. 16cNR16C]MCE3046467.1 GNAT family N-acetyltransferase [Legionella sp. 16cNR16C]